MKTASWTVHTLMDFPTNNFGFIPYTIEDFFCQYPSWKSTSCHISFYMLLYFQQGSAQILIDKDLVLLEQETIVCVGPHSVCRFQIQTPLSGKIILFGEEFFSLNYTKNVLEHMDGMNYNSYYLKTIHPKERSTWDVCLQEIFDIYAQQGKNKIPKLGALLHFLLLNLDDEPNQVVSQNVSVKAEKYQAFRRLIEMHYTQEKHLVFYASQLHISVHYLNRICKENSGLSSSKLIRNRILQEAERYLLHTYKAVSEIAYDLGFTSVTYFITFFKKNTGKTPEQFRKYYSNHFSLPSKNLAYASSQF
jgi:AraC family transcriptional activator of pobA